MKVKYLMIGLLVTILPTTAVIAAKATAASTPLKITSVKVSPMTLTVYGTGLTKKDKVSIGSNVGAFYSSDNKTYLSVIFRVKRTGSSGDHVIVTVTPSSCAKASTCSVSKEAKIK